MANSRTPLGVNPRDKRPGDRRSLIGAGRPGGPVWYVLGVLMLVALAQVWFLAPVGRQVSYSEFKAAIRGGQVAEVIVGEQTIHGTYTRDVNGSRNFNTARIDDPKLLEDLEAAGVKYTGEFINRWLPEVIGWVLPLLLLFALWSFISRRMGGAEGGLMSFARSKHRVFAEDDVKVSFADVAGVDEAERELKEIVEFLQTPAKYTALGGRIPKGVLLVGPPGTGKTLLARAVAGEAKVPFFSMSGSEFVEMFVGVGAARVRDLFSQAEQKAPCIIFIDELDALGRARGANPMGSHEEREQTLNQLLAEMDGFDSRKAIIIMAATNRPEVLDPALLRPGRFDRQVLVDKPDVKGREAVLRIHTQQVKLGPDVHLKTVAARTAGFAGADLANLVNEAALLAARHDKIVVEMSDFDEAIDRLIAGLEKKRVMSQKEREIVAYHESGHALVATLIPGMDPVHKISIVQRGFGALGYTMQLPLEDRYLLQRRDLLNQLAVLLGGRAAEELALGEISTGAQNDLQRATDIARSMVTEWGMSDALGAINYDGHKRSKFLDIPIGPERGAYAEDTGRLIDAEVKRIMTDAHDEARRILDGHRDMLETVTRRLLEIEVMEGAELRGLLTLPVIATMRESPDSAPLPPGVQ
ncbi:MAG: ATP-dependent metallopeptidase FtsH/Yme1/Tma family protein [Acidobacteria bacterium]|nr:ATP-dependent metallopeptidase FtsH/Yme1/Tma family protein [Acidobacteriota bacterium]